MGVYRKWVNTTHRTQFTFPNIKLRPHTHPESAALLAFWISQQRGQPIRELDDCSSGEDYYDTEDWADESEATRLAFEALATLEAATRGGSR